MRKQEKWRPVNGFPRYLVSNLGRVKSLKRPFLPEDCILKPQYDPQGYQMVGLRLDGSLKKHSKRIHRLVIEAFSPIKSKKEVNHIDGDKTNNSLSNLEWCDRKHNSIHSWKIGLHNHFLSGKLDRAGVLSIRDACKAGHPQGDIAKYFGICQQHVSKISLGKTLSAIK